jgi:hypothetical protein
VKDAIRKRIGDAVDQLADALDKLDKLDMRLLKCRRGQWVPLLLMRVWVRDDINRHIAHIRRIVADSLDDDRRALSSDSTRQATP